VHQEQSWYSPKYGVKYPSPRLFFRHRAAGGWFFVTLLAPYEGKAPAMGTLNVEAAARSMRAQLKWDDGASDEVEISFGDARGTGKTRWKGSREGKPIGEEVIE